ncbi:MAG: hypothetical protein ABSA33_01810 [Candidatus Micrarchaeaceae archaeon]
MRLFRWLAKFFIKCDQMMIRKPILEEGKQRDLCLPKRRQTRQRTRLRGIQRGRIKHRCERPNVKKFIQERLDFLPGKKVTLEDLYNDYVSWSVVNGLAFETKNILCKALNFYCKNKLIYPTDVLDINSKVRMRGYAGMGLKPEEDSFPEPVEVREMEGSEDDFPF